MSDIHIQMSDDTVSQSSPEIPVTITVDGCLVSFNGTPTLWLNEPLAREEVLADALTQQVTEMYRRGYVHRSR